MEALKLKLFSGFVFMLDVLFGVLCVIFILCLVALGFYLIDGICNRHKDTKLIREYKAHRSEFEQWLKYKDKTMRGDY